MQYFLTLTNDFHHTSVRVLVRDGVISCSSMRRAERALCGMRECQCGKVRGPQTVELEPLYGGPSSGNAYRVHALPVFDDFKFEGADA